ncbi:MAG: DUF2235 domain-containing protein, partial [Pseudomonadales bacterium]|nr:DUF2235 domain-containing protein [Pseudomonadales bacterium]
RTSFWPEVWHERAGQQTNLHQVWFVGSHSNVGGGYRRSGLADVAFEWMVTQATRCGLRLKPGEPEVIHADANAHGKYFDSRDGFGMFYRYHPRRLTEELYLAPRDQGYDFTIYVHESVLERIHYRTANYSPLSLPTKFSVVNDDREVIANLDFSGDEQWHRERLRLDRAIFQGKWLYGLMLELALALIAAAVYVWIWPPSVIDIQSTKHEWLVSTLFYATPAMFENFIRLLVQVYPLLGASLVTTGVAWFLYNRRTISRTQKIAEQLALIVKRRFADKTLGENEKDQ